jgi:hypothetical protein
MVRQTLLGGGGSDTVADGEVEERDTETGSLKRRLLMGTGSSYGVGCAPVAPAASVARALPYVTIEAPRRPTAYLRTAVAPSRDEAKTVVMKLAYCWEEGSPGFCLTPSLLSTGSDPGRRQHPS